LRRYDEIQVGLGDGAAQRRQDHVGDLYVGAAARGRWWCVGAHGAFKEVRAIGLSECCCRLAHARLDCAQIVVRGKLRQIRNGCNCALPVARGNHSVFVLVFAASLVQKPFRQEPARM
jgi:hypothetical protein